MLMELYYINMVTVCTKLDVFSNVVIQNIRYTQSWLIDDVIRNVFLLKTLSLPIDQL